MKFNKFKVLKTLLVIILLSLVSITVYLFQKPIEHFAFVQGNNSDYNSSLAMIERRNFIDSDKVNQECKDILMDQKKKVEKVVMIYHGFTNCPKQFELLGKQLFGKGFTVYIPRMPRHGYRDLLTNETEELTSKELVDYSNVTMNIATGLGDKVELIGISGGGLIANWVGLQSPKVSKVMNIAPLYEPLDYPQWQLRPIVNLLDIIPNQFKWWDDVAKDKPQFGPKYAYPLYALKAINSFLKISLDLDNRLDNVSQSRSQKYILITGESDKAINSSVAYNYTAKMMKIPNNTIETYQFPADLDLNHDIIDPNQRQAKIDKVYPKLIELFIAK